MVQNNDVSCKPFIVRKHLHSRSKVNQKSFSILMFALIFSIKYKCQSRGTIALIVTLRPVAKEPWNREYMFQQIEHILYVPLKFFDLAYMLHLIKCDLFYFNWFILLWRCKAHWLGLWKLLDTLKNLNFVSYPEHTIKICFTLRFSHSIWACSVLAGSDNTHKQTHTHTLSYCLSRGRLRCLQRLWRQRFVCDNVSNCVCVSLHFHLFLLCSNRRGLLWLTAVTNVYHTHIHSHHHCGYDNFHMNMSCSDRYGNRSMHCLTLTWVGCHVLSAHNDIVILPPVFSSSKLTFRHLLFQLAENIICVFAFHI